MPTDVTQLPSRLQGPVQEYLALLQALAGERLRAVSLFGAAGEAARAGKPALIQNVVVLDDVRLDFVRELGAQGPALGRLGIQAPLLMSPEYIAASLDVFPIELLDIQHRHLNVLGEDYFAPLKFDRTHVRLQLERELKRAIIHLRQDILTAGGRDKRLAEIYWAAAEHTLLLLRAVLWLHDKTVPAAAAGIVESAAKVCGVDLSGLQPALAGARSIDFFALRSLYDSVLALTDYVDGLSV
ncbi:MAG: hypothetical protein V2A79_02055 [Planctomycetota bacterium]